MGAALRIDSYFGDWTGGRLGRAAFVASLALLAGALLGADLLTAGLIGGGAPSAVLLPVFALRFALSVATLAGGLNLAAKRCRDIGLPGWGVVGAAALANVAGLLAAPALSYPWLALAMIGALALAPGGAASRRRAG